MSRRAWIATSGALGLSLVLHGLGMAVTQPPTRNSADLSEGGETRLGNSFVDLAGPAVTPTTPAAPDPATAPPAPATPPATAAPAQTPAAVAPVAADGALPIQAAEAAPMPEQITATPVAPSEVITADIPVDSPRPQARPRRAQPKRTASPARAQPTRAQPTRTQSKRSAAPAAGQRRGDAGGTARGQQAQRGQGGSGGATAPARASDRELNRFYAAVRRKVGRGRVSAGRARGTAVISFKISGNGGLVAASVAKSSGNARLDQAALRAVQRAAPFPRPPAGAKRSFTLPFTSR